MIKDVSDLDQKKILNEMSVFKDHGKYRGNFLENITFKKSANYVEIEKSSLSAPLPVQPI